LYGRAVANRRISSLPVRRVDGIPGKRPEGWPWSMTPVRQLLDDGLDLGPVTVLVGENGSGKSTLVEALAIAYGMSREGGSTGARHATRETESALWEELRLVRGAGASKWGFFLRAETMHGFYSYLEENPNPTRPEPVFHEMSHGESFLALLGSSRFKDKGLYVLDEPESALSFSGCLALVGLLHEITGAGKAQAVIATHSPLVASIPGADIYELGEWGFRQTPWAELELVRNWQSFLGSPDRFLRHVIS
jgi:predicted ATPase